MGTRADFYVGRGESAEWIGSVAYDGHPPDFGSIPRALCAITTEKKWRAGVQKLLNGRDDATTPEMGWPWPWEDSRTTDYAYAFDGDKVYVCGFGSEWQNALEYKSGKRIAKTAVFPNMKSRQNVTLGGRSGIMLALDLNPRSKI